ncbi:MAG: hypothetical protein ABSD80_04345 [Caulobacteraceae bacterium]|jgi:hypothetical protein
MIPGNSEKVSILVSALEARYRAQEVAGGRVQAVCAGALALLLAAAAALTLSGRIFAPDETAAVCAAALIGWIVLRFVFLADLARGLTVQHKAAIGLEERLGLRADGRFGAGTAAVLPDGPRKVTGARPAFALLDVGLVLFLAAVLFRSDLVRAAAVRGLRMAGL